MGSVEEAGDGTDSGLVQAAEPDGGPDGEQEAATPLPPPVRHYAKARRAILLPPGVVPDITVGVVLGALGVTFSISIAALVYGADLQPFMARTIGMVLTGGILLGLVVSLLTSAKGIIGHVQDAPAAVLGALAAGMAVGLPGSEERWLTLLALVMSTTLLTGLLYFLVGAFRLGGLVRYLPYPVLGGFMAGTGWLLLTGGVGIMSGVHLESLGDLRELFSAAELWHWLPGVALACALLLVTKRFKHFLVWPLSLLASVGVFYAVMAVNGGDVASWRSQGLLVGPFPQGSLFAPISAADLGAVSWEAIASQLPGMLTVAFVCLIAMLLNATGIEAVVSRKVDLNRELRAAGLGNLLSGAFGGAPGYHGMSFTTFNYGAGTGGRLASIVAVAVLATTLFFGAGAIQYLPTVVIGGLVAFFGLGFLYDWLVAALQRLPLIEYLIMLAIFVSIVTLGVLPGVGVGLALAVVMFVISSSRTEAVRYQADLAALHSRASRPPVERALLNEFGGRTLIIQLQGFLFFGTARALEEHLQRHATGEAVDADAEMEVVVLDFQRVTGIDSSGIASVGNIARFARRADLELVLCGVPDAFRRRVLAAGGGAAAAGAPRFFENLDAALEYCEQRLLRTHGADLPDALEDAAAALPDEDAARTSFTAFGLDLEPLGPYLQRRELNSGEVLIRRGDEAGALYFLVAGRLTASLPAHAETRLGAKQGAAAGGGAMRLESMRSGSLVGELAFYRAVPRSADVTADTAAVVMVLSEEALERMTREQPELAAKLHRQVARQMAGRVAHLVDAVEALQR